MSNKTILLIAIIVFFGQVEGRRRRPRPTTTITPVTETTTVLGSLQNEKEGNVNEFTTMSQDVITNTEIPTTTTKITTILPPVEPTCKEGEMICANNCTSLEICVKNEWAQIKKCDEGKYCSKSDLKSGCDNGPNQCESSDPSLPAVDSNFKCSRTGTFPMLDSCKEYRECIDTKAYIMKCEDSLNFDQESRTCTDAAVKCANPCTENGFFNAKIGDDGYFYANCIDGKANYIYSCSNKSVWVDEKEGCVDLCREPGKYPLGNHCTKYRECQIVNGKMKVTVGECKIEKNVLKQWFNTDSNRCSTITSSTPARCT